MTLNLLIFEYNLTTIQLYNCNYIKKEKKVFAKKKNLWGKLNQSLELD